MIIGDKAYTDYLAGDVMKKAEVDLIPLLKKDFTHPVLLWHHYLMSLYRKIVETTGFLIERLLPKNIHAVTSQVFEIKGPLFSLVCSIAFF